MFHKVTMVKIRQKEPKTIHEELQWLGNSLGLFGNRDKDKSCFRIFITLVKTAQRQKPLASDDIAEHLHLSRGTVVHHLTKLIESGIVVRERQGYVLREDSLKAVIHDMRQDVNNLMERLEEVASQIDQKLG